MEKIEFGKMINTMRNLNGMTIEELCSEAEIVPSQLYYLESGTRNVGLVTISRVLRVLGIDLLDLVKKAM
ncbi:MAG: helix-turn-helix transcriptional regulator [Spirochaetales bacterium]|nr:helix-turn-helix transcriptional regulator [Spirochaetales bacterium]